MRQLAINLGAKRGVDTEAYIKKLHEVGFNAVLSDVPELHELGRITELLAANGMRYEMIHAPFGHINDIWLPGEGGDGMLAEMLTAVERAAMANCPTVVVHLTSGENPPTITDIGRARYEILVEYAARKNVKIAFENQRKLAGLAWAMENFAHAPNVGFCWDCGHEGCFGAGREHMPLFGDRLICTHLHDNDCVAGGDQHKLPFDGKLDFGRVARQLRESGYRGTLTLEAFAENTHTYDCMTWQVFLERAAMAAKRLRLMVDGF